VASQQKPEEKSENNFELGTKRPEEEKVEEGKLTLLIGALSAPAIVLFTRNSPEFCIVSSRRGC